MAKEDVRVYGPYTRKDGRKHVILIYPDSSRRTVSYPRWLVEQKLEHPVPDKYDVHHENEDHTDDSDSNLKLKLHTEHCADHSRYPTTKVSIICAYCKAHALKEGRAVRRKKASGRFFCSRVCVGKWTRENQIKNGLTNTRRDNSASVLERQTMRI